MDREIEEYLERHNITLEEGVYKTLVDVYKNQIEAAVALLVDEVEEKRGSPKPGKIQVTMKDAHDFINNY
jgi:hypothetical protein